MEWEAIYDLHPDTDYVAAVQRATLTTQDHGIEPTHGLFGSPEWWQQIENGKLPVKTVRDAIGRIFMGSMGDFPMFEVTFDNNSSDCFARLPRDGSGDGGRIQPPPASAPQ